MSSWLQSLQLRPALSVWEKFWRKEDFLLLQKDWVRGHLGSPDIHQSVDLKGMHSQMLKELVNYIAKVITNLLYHF